MLLCVCVCVCLCVFVYLRHLFQVNIRQQAQQADTYLSQQLPTLAQKLPNWAWFNTSALRPAAVAYVEKLLRETDTLTPSISVALTAHSLLEQ